jgi:hypothetical protein
MNELAASLSKRQGYAFAFFFFFTYYFADCFLFTNKMFRFDLGIYRTTISLLKAQRLGI